MSSFLAGSPTGTATTTSPDTPIIGFDPNPTGPTFEVTGGWDRPAEVTRIVFGYTGSTVDTWTAPDPFIDAGSGTFTVPSPDPGGFVSFEIHVHYDGPSPLIAGGTVRV